MKLTKVVTVNDKAPTDDNKALTNGSYEFTITGKPDTATAGVSHKVTITFKDGKATHYKVDSEAQIAVNGTGNSWTIELPNLIAGVYTIEETTPNNDMTLKSAARADSDESAVSNFVVTVIVEAGKSGTDVPSAAIVSFTNDKELTDFEFSKIWKDASLGSTEWPDDKTITVTVERKIGSEGTKEPVGTYTITKGNGDSFTISRSEASAPDLSKKSNTEEKVYTFQIQNLPKIGEIDGIEGEYEYLVTETGPVPGYKNASYQNNSQASGGTIPMQYAQNGGTIINTPEEGYELPETGGIGTTLFTALGGLMTVTAGAILTIQSYRRRSQNA